MDEKVLLDADIREPLILYLERSYDKVRFLEELVTGKARADIVMVLPDKVCGIEIKSDADSYVRLAEQVRNYDRYYDENYIVVGSTHALHAAEHVPEYWGIISVELIKGAVDFYRVREAKPNPKAKIKNKMSLLWKLEFSHILAENNMPKYAQKSKKFIGNTDEFVYLGGNEQATHKYVSELLGKETIDTNTYGKSTGRNGNYSTNYQNTGRELLLPEEVRMLDNRYALLFIRGERPIMDLKYDILKHPDVRMTTDGQADAYVHGEPWDAGYSIELIYDPELIKVATENAKLIELPETDFVLLSEEDVEREYVQKKAEA